MAIATKTQKAIWVGRIKGCLIKLPAVKTYDIKTQYPPIFQARLMDDPNWACSLPVQKPKITLSVKGWLTKEGADALRFIEDWMRSPGFSNYASLKTYSSPNDISTYEFSDVFRHCEETDDGYEFFNEDDTV